MYEWVQPVLQFIEKIIGHIAWPVVVLVAIFVFKKEFARLINQLIDVSYEFSKKVADLIKVKLPGVELEYISKIEEEPPIVESERDIVLSPPEIDEQKDQ